MLNCCIARKCISRKKSETGFKNDRNLQSNSKNSDILNHARLSSPGNDSSDDEFFEALEDQDDSDDDSSLEAGISDGVSDIPRKERVNKSSCTEGDNRVREGTLKRCGDLRLLVSGEPLYIPVTQVATLFL